MDPLTVPGTLDHLSQIREFVRAAASQAGIDQAAAYRLQLAVDEIATNAATHGYLEHNTSGPITLTAELTPEALTITMFDLAPPFDPRQLGAPRHVGKPVQEWHIGGLGVYLTAEFVDRFDYAYERGGNCNKFVVFRNDQD